MVSTPFLPSIKSSTLEEFEPVLVSGIWELKIPGRVHYILWLLTKNKILTRDNLAKQREVSDKTCLFCNELEYVNHLLFHCCVARRTWLVIAEVLSLRGNWNFEFLATFWLAHKKHLNTNIVILAVLWCLWNFRNKLCFQGLTWTGEKAVLLGVTRTLRRWRPMYNQELGDWLDLGDSRSGGKSKHATKNLLEWGSAIRVGDVGFSVLGTGLRRCDSE